MAWRGQLLRDTGKIECSLTLSAWPGAIHLHVMTRYGRRIFLSAGH